jgi:hypothetical protein
MSAVGFGDGRDPDRRATIPPDTQEGVNVIKRLCGIFGAGLLMLGGADRAGARVVFSFDYSLDSGGLFDGSTSAGRSAQAAMDRAGQAFSDRFLDNLTGITSGSGNSFSARIRNPGTGVDNYDPGLSSVAANVIKVYIGSRSLTFPEVGSGGAGGAVVSGSQTFQDNAASRGQAGALASPKTDFGPWGGSVAFDIGTPWYFGLTAGGLTSNKLDFLSVATHELAHLLGFSASQPSWAGLVSNGTFGGSNARSANGGVAPTVSGSHWLGMSSKVGLNGPTQVALMDASLPTGTRRRVTLLDWAAMTDVGWRLAGAGDADANGIINFVDFQTLEQNLGRTGARWSQGDFNEDGIVDTADYALLMKNYARQQSALDLPPADFADQTTVPEPPALGILGAVMMAGMRRTRRVRDKRRS